MDREYFKFVYKNKARKIKNRLAEILPQKIVKQNGIRSETYLNRELLNLESTYKKIESMINDDKPFLIGRYGGSELKLIRSYFEKVYQGREKSYDEAVQQLCELSGFFPKDAELADKFCERMLEISKDVDLLGVWYNEMEDYVCEKYAINAEFTLLRNLEPYYGAENIRPWTQALKGKKVLVVHPFSKSIQFQYGRRQEIWKDKDILPEFDLFAIKAVQTLASQNDDRFSTWFEALDYMVEQCKNIEFDVALIGCGAYGLPLAAEIKRMGKSAIHMGGALQILFGIKGKRWDNHPQISLFYNDSWIRPMEQERPQGAERVEGSCYW